MTSKNLENLATIGQLKREPPAQVEFDGLVKFGRTRLKDAGNTTNAVGSRFDLAYNAAHAFALAALRWHGYRSESRYLVFQVLPFTLGLSDPEWRVLALCHDRRNKAEYEGILDVDERLLAELIAMGAKLLGAVEKLDPPRK